MKNHIRQSIFILTTLLITFLNSLFVSIQSAHALLPTSKNPGNVSKATGRRYKKSQFEPTIAKKQHVGPDMVYVPGGRFTMGLCIHNLFYPSPKSRTVTIGSFWIAEVPVTNLDYREYLADLKNNTEENENQINQETVEEEVVVEDEEEEEEKASKEEIEKEEVKKEAEVAISPEERYQKALPNESVWKANLAFNDSYVKYYFQHPKFNLYPVVGISYKQAIEYCKWRTEKFNEALYNANKQLQKKYNVDNYNDLPIESGVVSLPYRLPTEAEWEYAALGSIVRPKNNAKEMFFQQNIYPWEGFSMREEKGKSKGRFRVNYKRGKGNYKGLPGENNEPGGTWEVYKTPPNALGIRVGGNIKELTDDIYRAESSQDVEDFNPYRRDDTLDPAKSYNTSNSLVNNQIRVIKGASWKDTAYFLQPATRRFLHEDSSEVDLGFRVAMSAVGEND